LFSAIILAAGEGSRMGRLKQLLPWKNRTIIETVLDNIINSNMIDDEIRLVLGFERKKITEVLKGYKKQGVKFIYNKNYKNGMLSSVREGLKNIPDNTEYFVFTLADKAMISPDIYSSVIKEAKKVKADIFLPEYKGNKGHPVILKASMVNKVYDIEGPGGLRPLINKYPERVYHFPLEREEIIIDLDYYHEYLKYKRQITEVDSYEA